MTVANLTFHGVGEPPGHVDDEERAVWLSLGAFTTVVDAVAGRRDVRLTFDDGNRSDVDRALPLLLERDLRASFFVVAGRIGEPGYLDGGDLRELLRSGMEVGSHGFAHRPWRGLTERELEEELGDARRAIEAAAGAAVTAAACPFGAYERRALSELKRRGYTRVYTSDDGLADETAWLQPRNTLRSGADTADVEAILVEGPAARAIRRGKTVIKRWR